MIKLIRQFLSGKALLCAILAPLSMLLEVLMDLQQPTLMSDIIDIGVKNGDISFVLNTGLHMILFALIGLLGGAACSICATYSSTHMAGHLRISLFSKIFSLSSAEVDKLETSSLITRVTNDVAQIQEMLLRLLRMMSRSPMLFIGGIIMAFLLSARLALILCASLPILTVAAIFIVKRAVPMYTDVQNKMDRVNTVMRENLLGIRVIKSCTLEQNQNLHFSDANTALALHSTKAQSATFVLMPVVTLLMNLSVVAVLWFGGLMQIEGALPMGRIMAFINYLLQITNALVNLVNFVINISRAQASAARISEVFATDTSVIPPSMPLLPEGADIRIDKLYFAYASSADYVLSDINLFIKHGQKIGIIGATGCGKSTLAALIARLYDPSAGLISIGGVDIRDIDPPVLYSMISIVLQNSLLFSGSIADNLRYGDASAPDEMLLDAVYAADAAFVTASPQGLAAPVAQRGSNLSGGQKQRLSIARSVLRSPQILILDDSTSAVDLITEARLQLAIRDRMRDSTLIIIAQRISSIMDCDSIIVMDKGTVAAQDSHANLIRDCELYRSIALSQLGQEALVNG